MCYPLCPPPFQINPPSHFKIFAQLVNASAPTLSLQLNPFLHPSNKTPALTSHLSYLQCVRSPFKPQELLPPTGKLKEVINNRHLNDPGSTARLTNSALKRPSILKLVRKLRSTPEGKLKGKVLRGEQRLKNLAGQRGRDNPPFREETQCKKVLAQWGGTNLASLKCILVNYGGGLLIWNYFKGGTPIKGPAPESTVFDNDNPISLAEKKQRKNDEQH